MTNISFTKDDTLVAKGVAVILLLIHHLFYSEEYPFSAFIFGRSDYVHLAIIGKICVAMFLILSGYGLSISWRNKNYTVIQFYKHVYSKLYKGFLPVALLSLIPVVFHCNNISFTFIWGNSVGGVVGGCIKNMLGLQFLWGEWGYNPTWLFISLIILLYAIFPLLYKSVNLYPEMMLVLCSYLFFFPAKVHCFNLVCVWLLPFVTGIYCSSKKIFNNAIKADYSNKKVQIFLSIIILMSLRVKFLKYSGAGTLLWLDTILAFLVIFMGWLFFQKENRFQTVLSVLGYHSMNIFLMHTFIFDTYLRKFSYALKYPPLIFFQLLVICLLFSYVLEKSKKSIKSFIFRKKNNDPISTISK